jgi:hypothetical protein
MRRSRRAGEGAAICEPAARAYAHARGGAHLRGFSSPHRDTRMGPLLRDEMRARELTRRSLLVAAAGALVAGLRPRGALGRAGTVIDSQDPAARAYTRAHARGGAFELATPTLPAGGGQPPIIAREVWARGSCTPRVAPEYGSVRLAFVHHTENPNGYTAAEVPAMLRAIFHFHRDVHGWNDIGYNFVVDRFGRIFEARAGGIDEPVTGAQAGGYNYCSSGIAVLGEYGGVRISPAARASLVRLLAWKLALHGTPIDGRVVVRVNPAGAVYSRFPANARVSLPRVAGHRDADSTDCPGNAFYGELPGVRLSAAHIQGTPTVATLVFLPAPAVVAPSVPTPSPPPAPSAMLGGHIVLLDGSPISGAPVEVQARSVSRRGEIVRERTLAQAQAAADGSWSVPVYAPTPGAPAVLRAGTTLRALFPGITGVPATISESLRLTGDLSLAPVGVAAARTIPK